MPILVMTTPHILRLPVELHLGVIEMLELQDRVRLASANRYFRSITKPPSHIEYLKAEAESWAKDRDLFACSGCIRFRRFQDFSDDMKKGKRTRGGAEAVNRLCLECGVTHGLYVPGSPVVVYGRVHMLCGICGTFPGLATRQSRCVECAPAARFLEASSTNPVFRRYAPRHDGTVRTARVDFDRPPMDELYGNWLDS
ncbi:hypothetical protein HBH56_108640 [Parastagonospora nodorum]|uniref:F-box domain-containing protein n=1 Tax=Phaeosphaeria nodorum (strain SN15 / ATCC MYA-4574 / FGSC 10173) TaxID=321614 RepID=A0A7U2FDE2_PHANO|nr:hypothetical protein HBH56_108640 [Parastagonospora nodorum]QRD03210.1 hypothetical protein JI435_306870 [Parastagonospora nodorum SN15]KAH3922230.1 hypothetical protein HBH54_225740 [Parastagonospora nodorum]KAH3951247.1 hypothetical protein HBH53_064370 [Parastagonospora nodorum]KAH3974212.1 hypothetical protein HBH51_093900 [Parastagonospora nodorum]